ncbi:MAG: hypothetical protein V4477_17060 [Pseudomonadota bacterium]
MKNAFRAWAAWHPTKGFDKHHYEGAFAYADLCRGATSLAYDLNTLDGTTNRNGWRVVPVNIVPEDHAKELMNAVERVRLWLAVEGCDEQREILDNALIKCGIATVQCTACTGKGEWDEGPLAATSRHQISPDYRHVVCPDCNGLGNTPLVSRPAAELSPPGDK